MKQPEITGILFVLALIASIFALYFAAQSKITKLERQLQQAQPVTVRQEDKR